MAIRTDSNTCEIFEVQPLTTDAGVALSFVQAVEAVLITTGIALAHILINEHVLIHTSAGRERHVVEETAAVRSSRGAAGGPVTKPIIRASLAGDLAVRVECFEYLKWI